MPLNFKYLPLIFACFPNAKVIHMKRCPKATCWSIYKHHFATSGLRFAYNLSDIVHYYKLYQELSNYWNDLFHNKIYNCDYDKLAAEAEIKKINTYLELEWKKVCYGQTKT